MENTELKPIIESLIFVSEEPISEAGIFQAISEQTQVEKLQVRECLSVIEREWNEDASRGIGLMQVAGGFQFRTKPGLADWLKQLGTPKPTRLSGPALETLAIVAYRQPLVRSEVEKIRGVDSGAVLKTLLDRHLLRIIGRRDEPGQPLLYGTTREFLEIFNLKTLSELPTLKDIEDLMRERKVMTESSSDIVAIEATSESDIEEQAAQTTFKRLADDEEFQKEDHKDMEALDDLEKNLKGLKRLERSIFPKEFAQELGENEGEGAKNAASSKKLPGEGVSKQEEEFSQSGPEASQSPAASKTDEAAEDDSTLQ